MTFAREGMALFGLLIVSINTWLISLDILRSYRRLGRFAHLLRAKKGDVRLWLGRLEGEVLPSLQLTQVGHSRGDGKVVLEERLRASKLGESVRLFLQAPATMASLEATGPVQLDASDELVWIWPSEADLKRAFVRPELSTFDEFEVRARAARGDERPVHLSLGRGEPAYVFGRLTPEGSLGPAEIALDPSESVRSALVVAGSDPRLWLRTQRLRLGFSLFGIALVFVGLIGVCFVPPAFGAVSQVGALGLLLFFLLVQPLGVYLNETSRMPHEAFQSVVWKRPAKASVQPLSAGSPQ